MAHSVVIGGAGFIGSWVVDEILESKESRVTVIDNLISSERWNVSSDPRVTFIEGSASELETFKKIQKPVDTIYQLACFHGNQSSIAQPLNDFENGLKSTIVTLDWARKNSPDSRIVYAGAGCAVAEKTWESPTPVEEIEKTSLIHDSPYSISKITGEMYCIYYAKQHNLDVVRIRFQNVYGPREILGAGIWRGTEHTVWRNVIPSFIWKALNNFEIEVYGQRDATRDFVFVEDAARGVLLAGKSGRMGEVYNLASGTETNILYLARKIVTLCDSSSQISIRERRSWDNSGRRFANLEKSRAKLNFNAETQLELGLSKTISWFIENRLEITKSISKHDSFMQNTSNLSDKE